MSPVTIISIPQNQNLSTWSERRALASGDTDRERSIQQSRIAYHRSLEPVEAPIPVPAPPGRMMRVAQHVGDVALTAAIGGTVAGVVGGTVAGVVTPVVQYALTPAPSNRIAVPVHTRSFATGNAIANGVRDNRAFGPGPLPGIDPDLDPSTWNHEPAPGPVRFDGEARQQVMDSTADAMAMAAGTGLGIAVITPILAPVLGPGAAIVGPVIGSGIGAGIVAIGHLIRGR